MNHTKTISVNHLVTRLVWSSVLIAGLIAGLVQQANAHEPAYRAPVAYNRHLVIEYRPALPRWLRRDIAFSRWYRNGPYYKTRYISWNRLYNLYLRDRHYRPHGHHGVVKYREYRRDEPRYKRHRRNHS